MCQSTEQKSFSQPARPGRERDPARERALARIATANRSCTVRANGRSSYETIAGRVGPEVALRFDGDRGPRSAIPAPHDIALARDAPTGYAHALLIYLKHRGVLNVEEFRRTGSRSP